MAYPGGAPVTIVGGQANGQGAGSVGNPFVTTSSASSPPSTKSIGSSSLASGQVAVTTSATQIVAARAGRQSVTLSATSAVVWYIGAAGVTASTGLYVAAVAGSSITLNTAAAVFAVGAAAVTISFLETF